MSSTNDTRARSVTATTQILLIDGAIIYFRDTDIKIYSDSDGNLTIGADSTLKIDAILEMAAGQQLNASADGIVTLTKAGILSDADFTTNTTGLIAIDTSNDRIYYRIGAADWSYLSADGGVSFPEKSCPVCGQLFEKGDEVAWVIDSFAGDGAPHSSPQHKRCT